MPSQKVLQLHRQYGPVVRVGPNEVSLSDWTAYREIYTNKTTTKTELLYASAQLTGRHDNIFGIRDKAAHQARRKLQNHSYSQQTVLQNESLIDERAAVLVRRMIAAAKESPSGRTSEVFTLNGLFSLEVIMKCAFNRDCGESPHGDSLTLLNAMERSSIAMATGVALPFITRKYGHLIPGVVGQAFRQWALWESLTKELLDQFIRDEVKGDAKQMRFMTTPMLCNVETYLGRKMTSDEVLEDLMGLTFAGSGTTSTLLSYLIWMLAKNTNIQDRLREELLGAGTTLNELQHLPLLNAVIKETHRVYPSFMGFLPRKLDHAITIGQYRLPKDATVSMASFVHQRDPILFPDPDTWSPDRWLSETKDMNGALTPFSTGVRNCIGQNLAKAELFLATSKIIRNLQLQLNEDMTDDDMEMEDRGPTIPKGRRLLVDIVEIV